MAKAVDFNAKVIGATMDLAATQGWWRLSLAEIATEAGVSLAELRGAFPTKAHILSALAEHVDRQVLAGKAEAAADDPARDRLFDVLMRRFDALTPYRDGLGAILRDNSGDPLAVVCGAERLVRSMAWMLEAAGLNSAGPIGRLRARALATAYGSTIPVWLRDETEDMSRTMAVLDRRLAGLDRLARLCGGGWRRGGPLPERPARGGPRGGARPGKQAAGAR